MPDIEINRFRGVFTNGDLEDLPNEWSTEQKNFRNRNGRLVKTKGFGNKISATLAQTIDNLVTYVHDSFTTPADYLYIGVYITAANVVTLYGYNGSAWVVLNSIALVTHAGSYYHKDARNPIVHVDQTLRILPGNIADDGGGNVAKGVWLGFIDRTHFDSLYTITAGFYSAATTIDSPDHTGFDFILNVNGGAGHFTKGHVVYYRFSYVYDGDQESLLPDSGISQGIPSDSLEFVPNIQFNVTESGINKRITGIKVYRSDNISAGPYFHIATIDYLRKSANLKFAATGCYNMMKKVFIPELSDATLNGTGQKIKLDGGSTYDIDENVNAAGFDFLTLSTDTWGSASYNDVDWILYQSDGTTICAQGTEGAYAGRQNAYIASDLSDKNLSGGLGRIDEAALDIQMPILELRNSRDSATVKGANILMAGALVTDFTNKAWEVYSIIDGNWFITESGTAPTRVWAVSFWDPGLVDGIEHPLIGEPSIDMNSEFARVISGRLWQFVIVTNPADKAEIHGTWLGYSELWQFDVNPSSNVRRLVDREGGDGTGLFEIFGNPVMTMKQAIVTLYGVKQSPQTDTAWNEVTSSHNIGNIAKLGGIVVRDNLYVCYYDGIYRFRPNNLAETDQTPLETLRVSEAIGDVYEALSTAQKREITSEYDQSKSEIVYTLGSEVWAFNIDEDEWRQIVSASGFDLMALDEEANVLVYKDSDKKIYASNVDESVDISWKSKVFAISDVRGEPIRRIYVTYSSAAVLTVKVYLDNSISATYTLTLPINTTINTYMLGPTCRAKKIRVEISDAVKSTTDTEIHRINIS